MRYFYARVSSREQNLERQLEVAREWKVDKVYADKQSGKNFDREQYQQMKSDVTRGDEVIVKELDRLGRNNDGIKEEIRWFRERGITLRILDIPTTLLDFGEQDWIRDMVTNILFEVLGAMAEQERKKTAKRREEGIKAMPVVEGRRVSARTGRGFGRPMKEVEIERYDGESVEETCKRLGISKRTYYRRMREKAV